MAEPQLRQSLAELRAELNRLHTEEESVRARLDALASTVEAHLEEPGDTERHDSLVEELRRSILELEVSHPRATAVLNKITAALGNVGG